ncbi:hypothetical protein Q31b_31240 [Novipirellula aureliae]|uniref:Cytochrome C n=1 Tax=Novipirellula aureliae TaxID=2527966 RepID=A0A5C6DY97_9BACT|nr:hypothetical protein [Novipirellula aureliae]TWU41670.1 hypothetical protein Q31b_31240 [Novipirellula aureliae]
MTKPLLIAICLSVSTSIFASAQERRAAAPAFDRRDLQGIFFDSLDDAIRGEKPSLSKVRQMSNQTVAADTEAIANTKMAPGGPNGWSELISPAALEDAVKTTKLSFDSIVTTPGAFNSGGYLDARLELSVLATLFAVINEYTGDVRWKDQAAAARDLISRTAFNCKAGSTQVYNEAKRRKADLQDLVSGSGLSNRDAEAENDWAMVVDRTPLMQYAERLSEQLKSASRDAKSAENNADAIQRDAQLLAMVGRVLTREGLDEADDEDYAAFSLSMTKAATAVAVAIERGEYELGPKVGAVTQSCDACHEMYR